MIKQTDAFNEHAHGEELANQDEADAVTNRQAVEDLFIYAVEILAVLAIIAVLVFGE